MIYIVGDGHKELTMVAKVRSTLGDEGTAKGTPWYDGRTMDMNWNGMRAGSQKQTRRDSKK